MQQGRTALIILLLGFASLLSGLQVTGSLWPFAPAVVILATVLLFAALRDAPVRLAAAVFAIWSVSSRLVLFTFPPSLYGVDPDHYATVTTQIVQQGSIAPISTFYSSVPLFHVHIAATASVFGVKTPRAMLGVSIISGILSVLVPLLVARWVGAPLQGQIFAAALGGVATLSIKYVLIPLPQTLAVLLILTAALCYLRWALTSDNRALALFLCLIGAAAVTHKLPVLFIGTAMLVTASLLALEQQRVPHHILQATVLVGLLFAVQMVWMTGFVRSVFVLLFADAGSGITAFTPEFATRPFPGITGILLRRLHGFVLIGSAGLSCLWLLLRDRSVQSLVVCGLAAATALFVAIGLVTGDIQPLRPLHYGEVFLVAAIAIVVTRVSRLVGSHRVAFSAVLAVFVVSQVTTPAIVLDMPNTPRLYLTGAEVEGKVWMTEHTSGNVATDTYYAGEAVNITDPDRRYIQATRSLLDGRIRESGPMVAVRSERTYRYQGWWRLTKPPDEFLIRESRIYTNSNVSVYN